MIRLSLYKRRRKQQKAIRCPAAEPVHPVLSLNDLDIQCRIAGHLQPAKDSKCCADYENCPVKKTEFDLNQKYRDDVKKFGGVHRNHDLDRK